MKPALSKSLRLHRETLRVLDSDRLTRVIGGNCTEMEGRPKSGVWTGEPDGNGEPERTCTA